MGLNKKKKLNHVEVDLYPQNIKKDEFEVDPAWNVIDSTPNVYVFRIHDSQPVLIDKEYYGSFYEDDSYIVVHRYRATNEELRTDIFIWIGKRSTADEYVTAIYKMVELDMDVFNYSAVKHREVQENESAQFLELFTEFQIFKGGFGLDKSTETLEKKPPKMLQIAGYNKTVRLKEVTCTKEKLNEKDVFVIDMYETVYLINGKKSSAAEKNKGSAIVNNIKSERPHVKVDIIDNFELEKYYPVVATLPTKPLGSKSSVDIPPEQLHTRPISLWKLSDCSGKIEMKEISKGKFLRSSLDTCEVYILDAVEKIFVWMGKETTQQEKLSGMHYATKYANEIGQTKISLVCLMEGFEDAEFNSFLE